MRDLDISRQEVESVGRISRLGIRRKWNSPLVSIEEWKRNAARNCYFICSGGQKRNEMMIFALQIMSFFYLLSSFQKGNFYSILQLQQRPRRRQWIHERFMSGEKVRFLVHRPGSGELERTQPESMSCADILENQILRSPPKIVLLGRVSWFKNKVDEHLSYLRKLFCWHPPKTLSS